MRIKRLLVLMLASLSFVACATTQTHTSDDYMSPMQKRMWTSGPDQP